MSNFRKVVVIVLIVLAFFLGYLSRSPVYIETDRSQVTVTPVTTSEAVDQLDYGLGWAVIEGKAIRGDGETLKYELVIALAGQDLRKRMTVSPIEYRLLRPGDKVAVEALVMNPAGIERLFQWKRDDWGRLQINYTRPIAVLDAGHGGVDEGQGTNDLWVEKEMNLRMTERMKASLEEAGIRVIMTRTKDEYVSLYDRIAMANYVEADIIISNHVNRMDGDASGIEVLYSQHSERGFALDLAEAISSEDHPVFRVYRRRHYDIPGVDYYFLHKYTEIPSYIVEYGFADNEADSLYIQDNWEAMTDRASDAIIKHLLGE